jgi:gamma-glutamyltranspeptidase/glutathione hydrolase
MRDPQFPGRSPVMSTEVMAATSQPMATQVAVQILREVGNAMDAAVAASATLAVVESGSTGIGGDCFILYHEARSGKPHALNGSGRSPAKATSEAVKAHGHDAMPDQGILSVTVPGAVDAWYTAHRALGRLDFAQLLQPAIRYAEIGSVVSPVIAHNWKTGEALLAATPEASAAYLVNGKAPTAGSIHRQPDLAASLKLIAAQGSGAFYEGAIAEEIVRFSDSRDGWLSLDDFSHHRSEWVVPLRAN